MSLSGWSKTAGGWIAPRAAIASSGILQNLGTVTVAGHPSIEVPLGTLNNILKQAGLK